MLRPLRRARCLSLAGALLLLPSVVAAESVWLWRLRPLAVEPETAARLEQVLAAEIGRVPDVRRFTNDGPAAGQTGCDGAPECLAALGRELGVERVAAGVVGRLGDTFSLDLKLVDVASGLEVRRVSQIWDGSDETLIEVMRQAATRLLRPEAYMGRLALTISPDDVGVFVDGEYAGRAPLPQPLVLAPGRHALKLVREGYRDVERFAEVVFDRTLPLRLELQSAARSEVVPAVRARDWLSLGIRFGLVSEPEAFAAPAGELELGVALPFWDGRLSGLLATGASSFWEAARAETDPGLGSVPVDSRVWCWPVRLGLLLRLLPEAGFSPALEASAVMALVWQELRAEGFEEQLSRDLVFGFQAQGGLEYRLGPGLLLLQAGYRYLVLPTGGAGLSGSIGGLVAELGYRLWL